jgi:hypothetical protein
MTDLGLVYQQQVQKQFSLFGSALFEVTYYQTGQAVQNEDTGSVTTPETAYPNLFVINDRKKLEKMESVTIEEDETGVGFPALDLAVTPDNEDYYVTAEGKAWRVTGVFPDNFTAYYILKVKRDPSLDKT